MFFCKLRVPTGDQVVVVPDFVSGPMPEPAVRPVVSSTGAVSMCI
jgi:hypothetical protein